MSDLNKIILTGRLTRDVELRHLESGTPVANLGLAVNRKFKDQEEVTFFDCTAWQRTAEVAAEYLSKGSRVLVEGRMKLDEWEIGGEKRSKLKVVVENLQFLDAAQQPRTNGVAASQEGGERAPVAAGVDGEEIPF